MVEKSEVHKKEETIFREKIRSEFTRFPYIRFPLGNQATFDDLFMNPYDYLKIIGIIDYKIEVKGVEEGNYRLSDISDDQQYQIIKSEKWGKYVILIIKLRQAPTLKVISEQFSIKAIKKKDPYLIMITIGNAIGPFLKGGRIYYSTKRLKSTKVKEYHENGKIIFCRSISDIPDELDIIFKKFLKIQNAIQFNKIYDIIENILTEIKLGIRYASISRRYITEIDFNLPNIRSILSSHGYEITEPFDKYYDLIFQELQNREENGQSFTLDNPNLFRTNLRQFEKEVQNILRGGIIS
jgi:hypothetical protein